MRVKVSGTRAELYVNGAEQPTLIVQDLKLGASAAAWRCGRTARPWPTPEPGHQAALTAPAVAVTSARIRRSLPARLTL